MRRRFLNPQNNKKNYLTFDAIEDSTFSFTQNTIQYSMDGTTWNDLTAGSSTPTVNAGSKIYFKATNPSITEEYGIGTFSSTGEFNISGNIMSMLYGDDFIGKTDLTGKDYAFRYLFKNCTKLVDASELILPATTLAQSCYDSMFSGCTNLTTAPELPATTLASYCYRYMFSNCTSLVTAPVLPAATLANGCYGAMFENCTSLTTAPELPATTLAKRCYQQMFYGCTSLTTAPELPATTLTDYCYSYMFSNCTSLVTAPELPVTTLTTDCYKYMFANCKSLTTAPELPAITLANNCYSFMFGGCTSLTTAPALPATTLKYACYYHMFQKCSILNEIRMMATDISATDCLTNWVDGVASTGTFVKHSNMNSLPTGASGIPSGWTVVNYEEMQYLTFEAIEDSTFSFTQNTIQYSVDGTNWNDLTAGSSTPTVNAGSKIYFKATNPSITNSTGMGTFSSTGEFNISGNIMSMLYGDDFTGQTDLTGKDHAFKDMFNSCVGLVDASELILPATTLTYCCYQHMFAGCTSLTTAPELPATTLEWFCYTGMFYGCTSLTTAPELPATTLVMACYFYMFDGCSNLNNITMLATDISASNCLNVWVNGVASTGTFIKHPEMTSLPIGASGIPSGWTVSNANVMP